MIDALFRARPKVAGALMLTFAMGLGASLGAQESAQGDGGRPEYEGQPVVVESSSKSEERVFESPDAVSVIDRREIERRVPEDLGDVVRGQPGVYLQRTAAGHAAPFLRGQTGKQVLLMIDGIRFNNSAFRDGPNQYFAGIDPFFAERIEIIRGPFSVLYGSDALGGVINVITRKPRFSDGGLELRPGARVLFSGANRGRRITGDVPFGTATFAGYASASAGRYGEIMGGPQIGLQPFTDYHDQSFTGGFTWKRNAWRVDGRMQYKSQFGLFRTDKNTTLVADPASLPTNTDGSLRGQDDLRKYPRQDDLFSSLNLRHSPGGTITSLDFDLSYHRVNEEVNRIKRDATSKRKKFFTVDTIGFTSTAILDYGPSSRVTAGLDLYYDQISSGRDDMDLNTGAVTNKDDSAQFPDGSTYLSFGLYAQDEIFLLDGMLELRPGVRLSVYSASAETSKFDASLDDVSATFADVTGAFAATLHTTDWFAPTVSIGRGFRAPNLDDLAASKNTGSGDEIPNPDLKPEELIGGQFGAKFYFENNVAGSAAPYRFQADAYIYEHWLFDATVKGDATFGGNSVVQLKNTGRARINGWEVAARYYLPVAAIFQPGDALGVWGNATFTHGDDLSAKVPFARIPPLMANIGIRYEFFDGSLYLEPSAEIWDKQDRRNPSKDGDVRFAKPHTPGFTIYHIATGWNFNEHFSLNLSVRNITNKNYQTLGSGVFGTGTDARLSLEVRW